MSLHGLD